MDKFERELMKKKYTKKQLKEQDKLNRSSVGLSRNMNTISMKSHKDYNRSKLKNEMRYFDYEND